MEGHKEVLLLLTLVKNFGEFMTGTLDIFIVVSKLFRKFVFLLSLLFDDFRMGVKRSFRKRYNRTAVEDSLD